MAHEVFLSNSWGYDKNVELQIEEAISENLLSNALVKFMEDKDEWRGTATELLAKLEGVATTKLEINVASNRQWPKAAKHTEWQT